MLARLAVPVLLVLAGAAGADVAPVGIDGAGIDLVEVHKAARTLELYAAGRLVRRFEQIQLGDAPIGPKRFAGDERTPEGRYTIDFGNERSAYYLSLHISYPSPRDRVFASAEGRSPGGAIFIHGQPNSLRSGRIPGDWTDGCIALSNDEIEQLWALVPDGTPILLSP